MFYVNLNKLVKNRRFAVDMGHHGTYVALIMNYEYIYEMIVSQNTLNTRQLFFAGEKWVVLCEVSLIWILAIGTHTIGELVISCHHKPRYMEFQSYSFSFLRMFSIQFNHYQHFL